MNGRHLPPASFGPRVASALSAFGTSATSAVAAAVRTMEKRFPHRAYRFTGSGTAALTLAMKGAVLVARGNHELAGPPRVAVPAWCCPDIGSAAQGAGVQLVPYDLVPATLEPDIPSVRRAFEQGAVVLVVAHFFGRPTPFDVLRALSSEYGAIVIEDAAQGAGGAIDRHPLGAVAPFGVLSFGRGKGRNAAGGGVLLMQPDIAATLSYEANEAAPNVVNSLTANTRALVSALAGALLAHPSLYKIPSSIPSLALGQTRYHAPQPDHGPTRFTLALLSDAFEYEEGGAEARLSVANHWREALAGTSATVCTAVEAPFIDGALRLPIMLSPDTSRNSELLQRLSAHGVVRSYPRTLREYPELAGTLVASTAATPGATALANQLFTAPTHRYVHAKDIDEVARLLRV